MTDFKYFESNLEQNAAWKNKLRDSHSDTLHLLHAETDPYKRNDYAKKIQHEKDRQLKHLGKYLFQGEKLHQSLMQVRDTNSRRLIESLKNADKEEADVREKLRHKLKFGKSVSKDTEYGRKQFWSNQSVELEAMMKPFVMDTLSLPDYRLFSSFQSNLQCGIVESIFISRTSTVDGGKNSLERICSKWNFSADNLLIDKCIVCKEEVETIVTELVLDFVPFSKHVSNEEAVVTVGQQRGYSGSRPTTSTAAATIVAPMATVAASTIAKAPKRDRLANIGNFKTHAVLKAMLPDGRIHLRPLCTSGDVLLAVHELMDSETFVQGAVQFPSLIRGPNIGCNDEFVKYTFKLNSDPHWQLLKLRIPEELQQIIPFVCTSLCGSRQLFAINDLNSISIPPTLLQLTNEITRQLCAFVGEENMLVSFSLDIEPYISYAGTARDVDRDPNQTPLRAPRLEFRLIQVSDVGYCRRYACFRRPAIGNIINGTEKAYLQSFSKHFQEEYRKLKIGRGASIELDKNYEDYDIGCTDKIINAAKMKARKLAVTLWQKHLIAKDEESSSNSDSNSSDNDEHSNEVKNNIVVKTDDLLNVALLRGEEEGVMDHSTVLNIQEQSTQLISKTLAISEEIITRKLANAIDKIPSAPIDQDNSDRILSAYDEEESLPLRASSRRTKRDRASVTWKTQSLTGYRDDFESSNKDTQMAGVIYEDRSKEVEICESTLEADVVSFPKLPVYPITAKSTLNGDFLNLNNKKSANEKLIDDLLRFDEALNDIEGNIDASSIEPGVIDSATGNYNNNKLSPLDRKFVLAAQAVAQQLSISDIFIEEKVQTKLLNVIEGIILMQQKQTHSSGFHNLPIKARKKKKKKMMMNSPPSMNDDDLDTDIDVDGSIESIDDNDSDFSVATENIPTRLLSTMLPNLRNGVMNIHVDDDLNQLPRNAFDARDYMDGIWRDLMKYIPAPLARTVKKKLAKFKKKKVDISDVMKDISADKTEPVIVKIPVVVPAPAVPIPPIAPRSSFVIPPRKFVEPPDFGEDRVSRMSILIREGAPVEKDQYIIAEQSNENLNGRKVYNRRMTRRLLNMMSFITRRVDLTETKIESEDVEESNIKKFPTLESIPVVEPSIGITKELSGGGLWGRMLIEEGNDDDTHDDGSVMETDSHRYDIDSIYRKLSLGDLSQFGNSQDLSVISESLTSSSFVAEYIQMVVAEATEKAEISIDNQRYSGMDIQEMLRSPYFLASQAKVGARTSIYPDATTPSAAKSAEQSKLKFLNRKKSLATKVSAVMALTRGAQNAAKRSLASRDETPVPLRLGVIAETIKLPQTSLSQVPAPSVNGHKRLTVFDRQTGVATNKQPFAQQQVFSLPETSISKSPFSLSDDILASLPSYRMQPKIDVVNVEGSVEFSRVGGSISKSNRNTNSNNHSVGANNHQTSKMKLNSCSDVTQDVSMQQPLMCREDIAVPPVITTTASAFVASLQLHEINLNRSHYIEQEGTDSAKQISCSQEDDGDDDDDNMYIIDVDQISRYIEESTIGDKSDSVDFEVSDLRETFDFEEPYQLMAQTMIDDCIAKFKALQPETIAGGHICDDCNLVIQDSPKILIEDNVVEEEKDVPVYFQNGSIATASNQDLYAAIYAPENPLSKSLIDAITINTPAFCEQSSPKGNEGCDSSQVMGIQIVTKNDVAHRPASSFAFCSRDALVSRNNSSRKSVMFDIDQLTSLMDESIDVTLANSLDLEYRMRIGTAEIRIPHPPNISQEHIHEFDNLRPGRQPFIRQGGRVDSKKTKQGKEEPLLKEFGFKNISAFFESQRILAEQDNRKKDESKPIISKAETSLHKTSSTSYTIASVDNSVSNESLTPQITISRVARSSCDSQVSSRNGKENNATTPGKENERSQSVMAAESWLPSILHSAGVAMPAALSAPGENRSLSSSSKSFHHASSINNMKYINNSNNKNRRKLVRPGNMRSVIVAPQPDSFDSSSDRNNVENFQFFVASPIKPSYKPKTITN